jgi:hypothetical protein
MTLPLDNRECCNCGMTGSGVHETDCDHCRDLIDYDPFGILARREGD